jgi:hypothetical protein
MPDKVYRALSQRLSLRVVLFLPGNYIVTKKEEIRSQRRIADF